MFEGIKEAFDTRFRSAVAAYESELRKRLANEQAALTNAKLRGAADFLTKEAFRSGDIEQIKSAQDIAQEAGKVLDTDERSVEEIQQAIKLMTLILGNKQRIRELVRDKLDGEKRRQRNDSKK
ncbi:MAG: hypothetical protein Q7S01_04110 [bacterium]|nr:hypothetical protein [bacterium]